MSRYPAWVPERVVRIVSALVVALSATALGTGVEAILWFLVADFAIRGFLHPRFSPLAAIGRLFVSPRRPARRVAAAPKRFAARLGFGMLLAAAVLWTGFGLQVAALALVVVVMALASLEAVAGFCLGCVIYGLMARVGWVGGDDCPTCATDH